jgi:hypothetical protein
MTGLSLSFSSNNNTFTNPIGTSNNSYGISLSAAQRNVFINPTAIGYLTNSYGIVFSNSNNTIIQDCINITGIKGDVFYSTLANSNNTFINCSYRTTGLNESVYNAGSSLIRKWYYRAYVNDSAGGFLSDVNITALNISGATEFTGLMTNGSGWTNITTITDYVSFGSASGINRSYYSNYSITASGYSKTRTHSYNVTNQTNNLYDYFTMDVSGPEINITYPISGNYTSLVTTINY